MTQNVTQKVTQNVLPIEHSAADAELLAERIRRLRTGKSRVIIGLTGGPGAGKSTLATALLGELGTEAVVVPMDGFHFAQAVLERHGTADVKGAPHTFDADGYLALLRRLRSAGDEVVYAPVFDRSMEEPIGSAIPVAPEVPVVLTEGNYLLLDRPPWNAIRGLLDEVWFLDPGESERVDRLVHRHVDFGRTAQAALDRATTGSDADNARLVDATRTRADLIVRT